MHLTCLAEHIADDSETSTIPQVTGSAAEFCIVPMLSCIGDVDVMFYYCNEVAIPEGHPPPTWLPAEFDKQVQVYEIRDTEFPGYVFLVLSYLLRKCSSDGSYSAIRYNIQKSPLNHSHYIRGANVHGPAYLHQHGSPAFFGAETLLLADGVICMHSLVWPPQAADWPTRYRKYGWPDSTTIDCVVSKGSDVVAVAHTQCKLYEWMSDHQWRLSFSRAEVELINRWMPEQQIVYHMLRVFMKTERLRDSASGTISNYHIKTLMLWACELQPRSWWTSKSSLVAICAHLLRRFSIWLTAAHCQHYFVSKCNLFSTYVNSFELQTAAAICQSMSEESLAQWFVDNYVRKCAKLCPDNTVLLFEDMQTNAQLQNAMSAIKRWKQHVGLGLPVHVFMMNDVFSAILMSETFSDGGVSKFLALGSCLMSVIEKYEALKLPDSLSFSTFLNLMLSMLCITEREFVIPHLDGFVDCMCDFIHRYNLDYPENKNPDLYNLMSSLFFSQKNSAEFQDRAATLMKFLSVKEYGPEDWASVTIANVSLHIALRSGGAKNNGVYCLTNVYVAVLYYITGQYQTAIDHCTLVTRSQRHSSKCSSHVVDGKLLPKIDDNIDNALGLSVLYQYIRMTALNQREQNTQHVGIFTTEMFAHYVTLKCLLYAKCFLAQVSLVRSTAMSMKFYVCQELEFYRRHMLESNRLSVSDLLLAKLPNLRLCSGGRDMVDLSVLTENPPKLSELTQLLRQNSVENLLSCPRFREQNFGPVFLTYFEPLILFRCCLYEKCIQICHEIAMKMINSSDACVPLMSTTYCEFVQLMDTDLVSLMGLMILVNPDITHAFHTITISQLPLSLYLITRCMQLLLRQDVASLLQTLDLVDESLRRASFRRMFDIPVLHLSRKLLLQRVEDKIDEVHKPATSRQHRPVDFSHKPHIPMQFNPSDLVRPMFHFLHKIVTARF